MCKILKFPLKHMSRTIWSIMLSIKNKLVLKCYLIKRCFLCEIGESGHGERPLEKFPDPEGYVRELK